MNKIKIIFILILLSFIPMVNADLLTPPNNTNISGYISSHNQTGTWFKNPTDIDYDGFQLWYDDIFIGNKSNSTIFYNAEFLSYGNHTLSIKSFDLYGNVNSTWMNITMVVNNGCYEEWFCDDYCSPFIIETRTPIDPINISQGQLSTQSAKRYTDISIFYVLMIISIGMLILSRSILSIIRSLIFGSISIISSFTLIWVSLSIAYVGNFTQGVSIDYINQTNSAIFYYQVIQVVTQPWITILCICILIISIINIADLLLQYIQNQNINNNELEEKWKI